MCDWGSTEYYQQCGLAHGPPPELWYPGRALTSHTQTHTHPPLPCLSALNSSFSHRSPNRHIAQPPRTEQHHTVTSAMLRSLTRLGGMSSSRIHLQQPALARISIASFHMGSRPNAVSVSTSTATSPSTPLPPPMAASIPKPDISTSLPSTKANTAAPGTDAGPVSGASSGQVEEEIQDDTESAASTFAEFTPVSPDQARSLTQNPILSQLVNTIMKDGKKARAQRFVADALLEIRSRTQSDPYHVILDALELASPILKLTAIKKGSKVLQVPTPMTERQRRRKAIVWILEASDKRKGEKLFKDRLASEFLAVVNGNSGALVKKNQLHKMALANRANASLKY